MKKSEIYQLAAEAVANFNGLNGEEKVAIIERLLEDRNLATFRESRGAGNEELQ